MPAPSESFVAALTEEETCPLCLDGYAPVDEAICAICDAPSCPGCVEQLDAPSEVQDAPPRCFACRPALTPPPLPTQALAARAATPAGRDAMLPPALPLEVLTARSAQPPPLPRRARGPSQPAPSAWSVYDENGELIEGGLMVFPAWRKRPLLALARAADAVHLVGVSSVLVGWAYTGGRRFALAARVSRASREWNLTLRARSADLRRYGLQLRERGADLGVQLRARGEELRRYGVQVSLPILSSLRLRGAVLSRAIKVRALVLAARTVALSRRVPQAARTAWSHVPATVRVSARLRTAREAATARRASLPARAWPPLRVSREQLGRCGRSVGRACGACFRAARKPFDSLSTRLLTRSKHAN